VRSEALNSKAESYAKNPRVFTNQKTPMYLLQTIKLPKNTDQYLNLPKRKCSV
jgi:hypothetical protein